jgi:hypothetical protein
VRPPSANRNWLCTKVICAAPTGLFTLTTLTPRLTACGAATRLNQLAKRAIHLSPRRQPWVFKPARTAPEGRQNGFCASQSKWIPQIRERREESGPPLSPLQPTLKRLFISAFRGGADSELMAHAHLFLLRYKRESLQAGPV